MAGNSSLLPSRDQAYDTLFNGVQREVFFETMAGRGYAPQTVKQAEEMLAIAGKLQAVAESEEVKTAEDANDPYAMAGRALDNLLGAQGLNTVKTAQAVDAACNQAATYFAANPDVYNSVLAIKAAEAQALTAARSSR